MMAPLRTRKGRNFTAALLTTILKTVPLVVVLFGFYSGSVRLLSLHFYRQQEARYVQEGGTTSNIPGKGEDVKMERGTTNNLIQLAPVGLDGISRTNTVEKRDCILYVGPHKTGTSALEAFLGFWKDNGQDTRVALEKDNYKFPFEDLDDFHNLAFCLSSEREHQVGEVTCEKILNEFNSFIAADKGNSNIIVAHENFDFSFVNITEVVNLLEPHYKINVILGYRRFYEWIYSLYAQEQKKSTAINAVTFVDWLKSNDRLGKQFNTRYSAAVYERYKSTPGINKISVSNRHHNPTQFDVVENFVCDYFDAPHTCELARSRPEQLHKNAMEPIDWKVFRGELKKYHSIVEEEMSEESWQTIKDMFDSIADLPRKCLPDELQKRLLNLSVEAETALMPESFYNSEEGLVVLRDDFKEKIKTKMCDVDVEAIVMSPGWQAYLEGIETTSRTR